jgi:hypothetical protein
MFSHQKQRSTGHFSGRHNWRDRLWQLNCGILGLMLSQGLAFVITGALKNTTGKPRPDLIDRCQPKPGSADPPVFGLSSHSICTQTDNAILKDGFRSFPSGHSSCSSIYSPISPAALIDTPQHSLPYLLSHLLTYLPFASPSLLRWSRLPVPLPRRKTPRPRHPRRSLEVLRSPRPHPRRGPRGRIPYHGRPAPPLRRDNGLHARRRSRLRRVQTVLPACQRDVAQGPRIPRPDMGEAAQAAAAGSPLRRWCGALTFVCEEYASGRRRGAECCWSEHGE